MSRSRSFADGASDVVLGVAYWVPRPRGGERVTRGQRGCPPLSADNERLRRVVFLRGTGATLAEIGAAMHPPVTGERVRQLLARAAELGICAADAPATTTTDPLVVLRAIRRPDVTSLERAAACCGVTATTVGRVVRELGMAPAVARYLRWKRRAQTRRALAARVEPLARALGRWPSAAEARAYFAAHGLATYPRDYQYAFGGWNAAARYLGWEPRPRGHRLTERRGWRRATCRRGHPFDAANTYVYRGGRSCKACRRERERLRSASATRAAIGAKEAA